MALTDVQLRKLKPTGKEYQIADGHGLVIVVRAKGTMQWRYEYRINGKKQKLALGTYPSVTLTEARRDHQTAKLMVNRGICPLVTRQREEDEKQQAKTDFDARMTFGEAASRYKLDWVDRNWKNPEKGFSPVRLHLLPNLKEVALEDIEVATIRELLYSVREHNGVQAALHAHGWATRIFGYAIENDWCKTNPALQIKAARIGVKGKRTRFLSVPEIRRYLIGLYQAESYRAYKLALHLLLILALRKNELCQANWKEFDLEKGEWIIPATRMKAGKEHCVFLPMQAIEILKELALLGRGSEWVLPMPTNPNRCMNGNNLDGAHAAAINSAGIEDYVIHDHRHTASTQLREFGHLPEVVETALSHAIPGVAGVYAHTKYKEQRLAMLQNWADFLDATMTEQLVLESTFRKLK
jgi:integrase